MRTEPGHKRLADDTVRQMFTLHRTDIDALREIAAQNGLTRTRKGAPNISAAVRFLIQQHQASTSKP